MATPITRRHRGTGPDPTLGELIARAVRGLSFALPLVLFAACGSGGGEEFDQVAFVETFHRVHGIVPTGEMEDVYRGWCEDASPLTIAVIADERSDEYARAVLTVMGEACPEHTAGLLVELAS